MPFDLVVAYEDRSTRNRALHLYDHLAQQLLDDYDFKCAWWKFDHLIDPSLREHSIDDAAEANMVILSLHAQPELPSGHQRWVEAWLARRDSRKGALVVMIGDAGQPSVDSTNMISWLRNAARLGHMDFFNHSFGVSARQAMPVLDPVQPASGESKPLIKEVPGQPMPNSRWGINE